MGLRWLLPTISRGSLDVVGHQSLLMIASGMSGVITVVAFLSLNLSTRLPAYVSSEAKWYVP